VIAEPVTVRPSLHAEVTAEKLGSPISVIWLADQTITLESGVVFFFSSFFLFFYFTLLREGSECAALLPIFQSC